MTAITFPPIADTPIGDDGVPGRITFAYRAA